MRTADDVIVQLRKSLYNDREWAFLPQVASGTGAHYSRTADAVALNCWPSRGMELHGIEIKCYGGDFKREMSRPEKAEAIAQFCDRWFIAIPAEGIVKPEQLPPTWGLIIADDKPRIVVPAAKLEPKPLTRAFVAAVLRAAQKDEGIPRSEHQRLLNEKHVESFKAGREYAQGITRDDYRVEWQIESLLELEKKADNVLKVIRRELTEVKQMQKRPPVDMPDDSAGATEQ